MVQLHLPQELHLIVKLHPNSELHLIMELQGFFELHCFVAITLPHQLQLFCICYTLGCNYTYPQNYTKSWNCRFSSNYTVLLQLHHCCDITLFSAITGSSRNYCPRPPLRLFRTEHIFDWGSHFYYSHYLLPCLFTLPPPPAYRGWTLPNLPHHLHSCSTRPPHHHSTSGTRGATTCAATPRRPRP